MKFPGSSRHKERFLQDGRMGSLVSSTQVIQRTQGYSPGRTSKILLAGKDICLPKKKDKKVRKI